MHDLLIIGGGPAAAAAGIYASRQNLKTLLITKSFGGQVAKKAELIKNYPGFEEITGLDLFGKFEKHLKAQEIEILSDEAEKVEKNNSLFKVFTADNREIETRTVIIATGGQPKLLNVEGEKEFMGKGVSYCTVCDGPLFKNKTVAVIGGGNSGFEAAIFLSQIVKKVYILEYGPSVKADEYNQAKVRKINNIEIILSAQLIKIQGDKFVKSIIYKDLNSQKDEVLTAGGVFAEIGLVPASSIAGDLVDFNEKKEIKVDHRTCETKTPGLFAAGDVTDVKHKQIVISAGEGAKAALSAYNYLKQANGSSW